MTVLFAFTIFNILLLYGNERAFAEEQTFSKYHSSRIVGGRPAHSQQYPFAAAIYVETSNSKFFCGGTLYQRQWIITAGQCVNGATIFTIHLGSISLDDDNPNRVTLATSEYYLHPDFSPATLDNDIGLIKLRMEIELSDVIQPVDYLAMNPVPEIAHYQAIGWGQTTDDNSSLSSNLQYISVSALSNEECKMIYGNQITDNMLCTAGLYNEGSCHGDTGSPLLEQYARYYFVHTGVSSFVSGNGCESTDPSGYTRTFPYVDWIRNLTNT